MCKCFRTDICRSKNKITVDDIDEVILVGGSTKIPKVKEIVETFTKKGAHSTIAQDLVVAQGAAYLASLLIGKDPNVTFSDIFSHDIGVEVKGTDMSTIARKFSHLPCKKAEKYQTTANNQSSIRLKVLEGNNPKSSENKILHDEVLSGFKLSSSPVSFEIQLSISVEGIIDVFVKSLDDSWQKTRKCVSTSSTLAVSPEEIERSRKRVQQLLLGKPLESTASKTQTNITEASQSITPSKETKDALDKLCNILKKARSLEGVDITEIEKIEKWITSNPMCSLADVERKREEVYKLAGAWDIVLKKFWNDQ